MDIIERAARAICIAQLNVPDEFSEIELMPLWKVYLPEARAVLQAIREPDEGMIEAGMESDLLSKAIMLATEAHAGQLDKGGQPYILHPLRVMLACETNEQKIAAVLHDTVEDTGLELSLIRHRFGDVIADAVDALSRRDGEIYTDFIGRCAKNTLAADVKMRDLEDNMDLDRLGREPTENDIARLEKYTKAKKMLWRSLAHTSQ